jgi:hypothetical protein
MRWLLLVQMFVACQGCTPWLEISQEVTHVVQGTVATIDSKWRLLKWRIHLELRHGIWQSNYIEEYRNEEDMVSMTHTERLIL